MRRREYIAALSAAAALPITAHTQQLLEIWRIGVLESASRELNTPNMNVTGHAGATANLNLTFHLGHSAGAGQSSFRHHRPAVAARRHPARIHRCPAHEAMVACSRER